MKLSFKIIGYGGWKLFWQLMRKWLSEKFECVSAAIANIDLSPISSKVDEVKSDVADVKADVADVKTDVADVKTAVENINVESADQVAQFFGIEGSYDAEAKGGERTNNTVIDECKVRFQDAFNGLLPTGFTMPNSVTVDNLTYTGTTNS